MGRFLSHEGRSPIELAYLGYVPDDPAMAKAICQRTPLMETAPTSPAARAIQALADGLDAAGWTPARASAA
jgi:MinD-like ATPase involved in chromosome partitioning or flagellar assembly